MDDCVRSIAESIQNDSIANAMKESSISQGYLHDRIREIIEDGLITDKEQQIEKYMHEIAHLR